jgi:glutamate synthase domain-containing protein 2
LLKSQRAQRCGHRKRYRARSGADVVVIDGFKGGTGAAPQRIRDNVGLPIELALASVDTRLREEGHSG